MLLTADPIFRSSTLHVLHQTVIEQKRGMKQEWGKVPKTMTKWVGGVTGVDDGSRKRANTSIHPQATDVSGQTCEITNPPSLVTYPAFHSGIENFGLKVQEGMHETKGS